MTPIARARPQQVAAIVVLVLLGGIELLPLFGTLGYEHALASGLVVPSAAAIAMALDLSRARGEPLACVGRGVASGLLLGAIAYLTALVHGLFTGLCNFGGDTLYFALTAWSGAVMGGVWGACVAEVAARVKRRRLVAVLLALAAPIACVAVSVGRFVSSPMIFAFDPFVGYFSGTLYDTVIEPGVAIYTYRAGSLATLVFVAFAATRLARKDDGRLAIAPLASSLARVELGVAVAALATSVAVTAAGPELDHWQTSDTIAQALGGARSGARCDVVFPDSLRPDESAMLVKDCEEELAMVEKELGARGPDRIRAFFFRDSAEKKRFMGAAETYIAKPWRHEVYLQLSTYPHPVLGHELAHVVAGSFGRGPFRVSGALGGLWPNPGLIEGTAVAASPDDDELTDAQWARAMMDLGILPRMRDVFGFGFLGQNSSKSYTVAGAFVRWVLETRGAEVVRAWYGGASIEQLAGASWDELDARFRSYLGGLALSPEALAYAKAKFDRPSVFGRKCPHVIDAWKRDAARCEDAHQIDKARLLWSRVLDRDPHDFSARVREGNMELRYGDEPRGRSELTTVENDQKAPRTLKDRAEEDLADAELLSGRFDAAAARYRALADRTLDEDVGRTLEVKALAATDPPARQAVQALLIGEQGRPPDGFEGAVMLGAWSDLGASPLADYLVGKNLAQHGFFVEAARHLDRALAEQPPTPRIGRELLRMRAVCACALGEAPQVARVRGLVEAEGSPFSTSLGRKESVLRLLSRCGQNR